MNLVPEHPPPRLERMETQVLELYRLAWQLGQSRQMCIVLEKEQPGLREVP